MSINSAGKYTSSTGESRSYPGYRCRAYHSGACENHTRVPEDLLTQEVLDSVRDKLFPQCDECDDQLFSQNKCVPDWLCDLTSKVQKRVKLLDPKVSINEISKQLKISITTVRKHLKKSYASEGAFMPDQRQK